MKQQLTASFHDFAVSLPSARVEIVPGAPHSMYWETPDLFNDALRKFLAEVYAG